MDRRDLLKVAGGTLLAGTSCAYAVRFLSTACSGMSGAGSPSSGKKWGMVIDVNKCQAGCTECLKACRIENNVAHHRDPSLDVHWIRKVTVTKKAEPEAAHKAGNAESTEASDESVFPKKHVILVCNHCDRPPCAQVCPVQATYKRDDGIVIVDHHRCIGCRYCMIACPYNARYFNFLEVEETEEGYWPNRERPKRSHGVAESCTLCAHRLDVVGPDGKPGIPACVEACQKAGHNALAVGDLNDPESNVSKSILENAVKRMREDLGTEPKVHYVGL